MSMEMMQETNQPALFRVEGTFDAATAAALLAQVASLGSGARVTVDFSRVNRFEDAALGQLADDLSKAEALVDVRGLTQHQRRLLAYFGLGDGRATGSDDRS